MASPQLHRLAQIKLGELHRQQHALTARYDALEQDARRETAPLALRLSALLDGLSALSFAQTKLHPTTSELRQQLRVPLLEATYGRGDQEMLQRALDRLLDELGRGRTRVTFAHLFGRLIEEQLATSARPVADEPPDPRIVSMITTPAPPLPRVGELLERTYGARPRSLDDLRRRFSEVERPIAAPLSNEQVGLLLNHLVHASATSPAQREVARSTSAAATTVSEVSDVLSILLERLDEWDWPASGVALRGEREHGKSRVHLDRELLDALLLTHIGQAWGEVFSSWSEAAGLHSQWPLFTPLPPHDDSVEIDATTIEQAYRGYLRHILDHELEIMSDMLSLSSLTESRFEYRATGGAAAIDKPSRQNMLLGHLDAQIRARLVAHPQREVWVLQLDLRDCFPALSHEAILECLRFLGVTPRWVRFLERYLSAPVRTASGVQRLHRGLPVGEVLGWALGELMLLPLELAIHDETGLRVLRLVDDVVVIADSPAQIEQVWSVVERFVGDLGLAINESKSGCVGITRHGHARPAPASVPDHRPRWGALSLHPDGSWQINQERVATLRAWMAEHVASASSVLEMSSRYNTEMTYLIRSLGLIHQLGEEHLDRVTHTLLDIHQNLGGPGQGIAEMIQARAARSESEAPASIPSPLLYWPVTAGGIGLLQPLLVIAARPATDASALTPPDFSSPHWRNLFHTHLERRLEPTRDRRPWWTREFEQMASPSWYEYVKGIQKTLHLEPPPTTSQLSTLIRDFIARGTEVGGRTQKGLSPYWSHVLHTYGPTLLDVVGTFRFLLPELVPLPLLFSGQSGVDGASGEAP